MRIHHCTQTSVQCAHTCIHILHTHPAYIPCMHTLHAYLYTTLYTQSHIRHIPAHKPVHNYSSVQHVGHARVSAWVYPPVLVTGSGAVCETGCWGRKAAASRPLLSDPPRWKYPLAQHRGSGWASEQRTEFEICYNIFSSTKKLFKFDSKRLYSHNLRVQ